MNRDYKSIAETVSQKYQSHSGLIGILWIGSASFGINDTHTDIDIRLLVKQSRKKFPMRQFKQDGIEVEVDEMSWQWLTKNQNIDSEERWIREKGAILYDPKKLVANKFNQLAKLVRKKAQAGLWESFKSVFYSNDIEKCLKRNDKIATALYFYSAIENILKFVFILHGQPVPPFKWRWHFLVKNKLLPQNTLASMNSILLPSKSLEAKLKLLVGVEQQLQQIMIDKGYKKEMVLEHWRF